MNFNIRDFFSNIRKWTYVIKNSFSNVRKWVFNIRKSSKFFFNIKNSFSNIKKINGINFTNIKFAILEIRSLFKNILTEFQVF